MAEYINRKELLKDINDSVRFSTRNGVSAELRGAHKIVDCIRSAPTVDVVEVVHGEWKKGHYEGGLLDGVNFDKCNICGHERTIENVEYKTTYNYCPKCGAKMDGERRSE